MRKLFFLLPAIIGPLMASNASATQALNFRIHHEYQSPRALGMGDAFVAVADDYNALFYNPAGMARREDGHLNMYIEGSIGQDIFKLGEDIDKASKTTGGEAAQQEAIMNVLSNVYGQNYYFQTSLPDAIWVRPGWGMGIIPLNMTADFTVHKQLGPALNATIYSDTIIAYGRAKDYNWFQDAHTSAGWTAKIINRGYLSEAVAAIDLAADPKLIQPSDFREGATLDVDWGMLYTPELPEEGIWSTLRLAKPTFGLVVRNIADYGFVSDLNLYNKEKTEEKPEQLYRRVDIGSRWEYPELWIFGGRGTLDFRDLLHPKVNLRKSTHLGFEFDWTVKSWWKGHYRVGLNQGYLTAGLSMLFTVFNLDLVTYGEDIGSYDAPKESRKWMLRLNVDI